jgi:hypothetical protein
MAERIQRLKTELELLEDAAVHCHPEVADELMSLIADMRAHVAELEDAMEKIEQDMI